MLPTLVLLTLTPAAAPVPVPPSARAPLVRHLADPVQRLRAWTERARRARLGLDEEQRARLRDTLFEVGLARDAQPERRAEVDLALLDLAGLGWPTGGRRTAESLETLNRLSALGLEELAHRFRLEADRFAVWLADEVLARPRFNKRERRIPAAVLLRGRYVKSTQRALLRAARVETGELLEAVLDALVGWPDPIVHHFFLRSLQPSGTGLTHLGLHIDATASALGPDVLDRLRDLCGRLYVADDWHAAARARRLVRALDAERAVPILIEGLATWQRRGATGRGSKRILHEVMRELQHISGRSIGPDSGRWNRWWTAVQEGRIGLPEDVEEQGSYLSSATFFGLRPVSDRVVFVVDRSGSMDTVFGTDGRTRYDEAVDQLVSFLGEAGADTRFAIVLFSDEGKRWRTALSSATDANIEQAELWLHRIRPEGGTSLFEGVRAALRLDRQGRLDADRLEVDTAVVLCDGATDEGPSWVKPWLRANNETAQIVFHCVQIGARGDGTLETLAAESGGEVLQHDG